MGKFRHLNEVNEKYFNTLAAPLFDDPKLLKKIIKSLLTRKGFKYDDVIVKDNYGNMRATVKIDGEAIYADYQNGKLKIDASITHSEYGRQFNLKTINTSVNEMVDKMIAVYNGEKPKPEPEVWGIIKQIAKKNGIDLDVHETKSKIEVTLNRQFDNDLLQDLSRYLYDRRIASNFYGKGDIFKKIIIYFVNKGYKLHNSSSAHGSLEFRKTKGNYDRNRKGSEETIQEILNQINNPEQHRPFNVEREMIKNFFVQEREHDPSDRWDNWVDNKDDILKIVRQYK